MLRYYKEDNAKERQHRHKKSVSVPTLRPFPLPPYPCASCVCQRMARPIMRRPRGQSGSQYPSYPADALMWRHLSSRRLNVLLCVMSKAAFKLNMKAKRKFNLTVTGITHSSLSNCNCISYVERLCMNTLKALRLENQFYFLDFRIPITSLKLKRFF